MLPTILKVFSSNPKKEKSLFDLERNDENSVIRISHLDNDNQSQIKSERLCNANGDTYSEVFPLCKYDTVLSNEYGNDMNKDWNVLEDFYRFQERRNALLDTKKTLNCGTQFQQKTAFERPNYSYTQLIYMAIESSANKALTVNEIYTWCEQNFPYYAHAVHGWKNSLRHNLSINKCFKKITKLGIGGRGSLWIVDPRERQHLVSTMCRSNVTYFPSSIIIQKKFAPIDRVVSEEPLECVQVQCDNIDDSGEQMLIVEKPRQEWTDTRLESHPCPSLSPSQYSVNSDTDYNDWNRSMSSQEPTYPIKTHWYNQCLITPVLIADHNYCLQDLDSVLNNPSNIVRHSFLSSVNPQLDSFSTSSDYNDEDWPRTPSPMSLHPPNELPLPVLEKKSSYKPPKPPGKKRGRPRKDGRVVNSSPPKVKKAPIMPSPLKSLLQSPLTPKCQPQNSHSDRINNMYNLNNFFNSL